MIKHNNSKAIEDKILTIVSLCKKIDAEFDNTTPNKYTILYADYKFEFSTYKDVINALGMLGVIKIKKGDKSESIDN